MNALTSLLQALGQEPDWTRCIVENQVGRDDYFWVHVLPEGDDAGWTVFVDLGQGSSEQLQKTTEACREYGESLSAASRGALPEIHGVGEAGVLSGALQRKIKDGRSLASALRTRDGVEERLTAELDRMLKWWFEVGDRPCSSEDVGKHLAGMLAAPSAVEVCGATGLELLRSQVSNWKQWPAISRFGTVKPPMVQVDAANFRFQLGRSFQPADPFWTDLFDLQAAVIDFIALESEKASKAARHWFDSRVESGFLQIGIDRAQAKIIGLVADLSRYCSYYQEHHPSAVGRRLLRDRIGKKLQELT